MILGAAANHSANNKGTKRKPIHDGKSDDDFLEDDEDEDEVDEDESEVITLSRVWLSFSWPVKEDEIVGKWFAVIFNGKKNKTLYIAKVKRRFLEEKNGIIDKLVNNLFKTKGTLLEDTPNICHLMKICLIFGILSKGL
eukprot:TCONS_00062774-protein